MLYLSDEHLPGGYIIYHWAELSHLKNVKCVFIFIIQKLNIIQSAAQCTNTNANPKFI